MKLIIVQLEDDIEYEFITRILKANLIDYEDWDGKP